MKELKEGNSAIHFKANDLNGNVIDLKNFKGKKLLISFFRKAACPFCNMGLQQLIKRHKEFEEKGIQVITLFASPKEEVLKYAGKQNPPFPIIADGDFKIYEKYGVNVSYIGMLKSMVNPVKTFKAMTGGFFSLRSMTQDPVIPADFLIDENQKIHTAYYGKDYDDHIPISEVLAWAA
ncbi:MAG: peroxiredoxin family protein [Saprospiraceae bacterium]